MFFYGDLYDCCEHLSVVGIQCLAESLSILGLWSEMMMYLHHRRRISRQDALVKTGV